MATEGRRLLESWKEIAAYLSRSERTCRRFEETLGLPIHRLDGTPRAHVFAYTDEIDAWLRNKLNHAQAEAAQAERSRGRKRSVLILSAAAAGGLVIAAFFVWQPFLPAPGPILPRNPAIAILPFDNPGKDTGLELWRTALADLVITDLRQSRYVNVVGITDLLRKLVELKLEKAESFSEEDLKLIAAKVGVDFVVTGSLARNSGDVVATVRVRDPGRSGPERAWRVDYAREAGVFAAADRLSRGIKRAVGLTSRRINKDTDRGVAEISTASPQAFELFSEGYRAAGRAINPESIVMLRKAVDADPDFALAYKCLYRACQSTNRRDDEKTYIRKAIDLAGRLSDRERGELEVLFYRYYEIDGVRELEALERLVRAYPQDRFGSVNYLGYLLDREEWDKALPVAEHAWPANRSDINLCNQLVLCYWSLGQGQRAESVLDDFIDSHPGHTYWREAVRKRSSLLTRLGRFDEALADLDRLSANYPNYDPSDSRGIILVYRHDFDAAEREFRKGFSEKDPSARIQALMLLRDLFLMRGRLDEAARQIRLAFEIADAAGADERRIADDRALLHLDMAYLHRLAGRPAEALGEVEASLQWRARSSQGSSPPLHWLHLKALCLADLGRWEDFDKLAAEIENTIRDGKVSKLMRIHHHLLGYAELKKGDYESAVAHFSRAVDLVFPAGNPGLAGTNPEYLFSLAEAQALLGGGPRSYAAGQVYERLVGPSVNRLHNGDIYARSLLETARYCDARASDDNLASNEVKEMRAKAVRRYREFLDLWGGSDPLFAPLVDEARSRLAALEGR